jgi:uncharacterized membrane protein
MVLSTVFMVLANVFNKMEFEMSPTLGVLELLFAQGVISIVVLMLWMNRNIKKDLVGSIDRSTVPALVFRCLSGALVSLISFQSLKYFNVSTVGMVCSLAPIFVCVLAYFMLKERMATADKIFLFAVFCSVILVLSGASGEP